MSLYDEVKATGGYLDHYGSDLYIEVNKVNTDILSRFPQENINATVFRNEVTGKLCYDVPFAYDPFWNPKIKL